MASQKQQYTILYGRLSQEDERAGESNSIQHQRELLENTHRIKALRIHFSLRMTGIPEQILSVRAGKRLWK